MRACHLVFKVDSLTYTVAKALSHGGHDVCVWIVDPKQDYGLSEGIYRCLRDTPRVTLVGNDKDRIPPVIDRLIVQVFPRPLESIGDVPLLARHAHAITLISAGDRSRSWRTALELQWLEARRLARYAHKIDRVLYKDGFHAHDLHALFKSRRNLGFDVHSQFLHDEALCRAVHARDWLPDVRRPLLANFLGSRDPAVRARVLDDVRPFFRSANRGLTSIPAGKTMYWHEYPDADPVGIEPREFLRILSRSDFTLCPRGYSRVTHRPMEALLRGSIPVLSADELDLYGVRLADGENCIGVPAGGWPEAVPRLASIMEDEITRMRANIHAMFEQQLNYDSVADGLCMRLGTPGERACR